MIPRRRRMTALVWLGAISAAFQTTTILSSHGGGGTAGGGGIGMVVHASQQQSPIILPSPHGTTSGDDATAAAATTGTSSALDEANLSSCSLQEVAKEAAAAAVEEEEEGIVQSTTLAGGSSTTANGDEVGSQAEETSKMIVGITGGHNYNATTTAFVTPGGSISSSGTSSASSAETSSSATFGTRGSTSGSSSGGSGGGGGLRQDPQPLEAASTLDQPTEIQEDEDKKESSTSSKELLLSEQQPPPNGSSSTTTTAVATTTKEKNGVVTSTSPLVQPLPQHHADEMPHNLVEDFTDQRLEVTIEQRIKDRLKKNVEGGPLKVLFLSADTGGGHRASAESLAKQFLIHFPGTTYDLLDAWTDIPGTTWPYRALVPAYKHMSRYPNQWRFFFHVSNMAPYTRFAKVHSTVTCERLIREKIRTYNPDVVVSVHPAMNSAPYRSVSNLSKEMGKHIPFFTVVTDYGTAHGTWFERKVEKCYVASDRITTLAKRRGRISEEDIVRYGLPIRQDFDVQSTAMGDRTTEEGKKYQQSIRHGLGLDPHTKTVLVMGGGEGVGGLEAIVNEIYTTFTKRGIDATVVVVCGRNEKLKKDLRSKDWDEEVKRSERLKKRYKSLAVLKKIIPSRRVRSRIHGHLERKDKRRTGDAKTVDERGNVKVVPLGFVTNMAEFMVASDVLVSKAGPGTIAEAAAVGLPCMLTSFLPGQEAGNVDIVVDGGFGAYSPKPSAIADELSDWLIDDTVLDEMSRNAKKEGHPHAAADIVLDIGTRTHKWMEVNKIE